MLYWRVEGPGEVGGAGDVGGENAGEGVKEMVGGGSAMCICTCGCGCESALAFIGMDICMDIIAAGLCWYVGIGAGSVSAAVAAAATGVEGA